ncbi:MAG: hypothetical protein LQ349_009399, partial [Xanthoria aureola]
GDDNLAVRVQAQTPPSYLKCGPVVDEPDKFRKCANLMLDYISTSDSRTVIRADGLEWFGGDCRLSVKPLRGADAATYIAMWYGFNFISAMCARQGRSGKAGGYGDVGRQLVLSIDDVKGPGAMLQLPAHANRTGLVQRRRASRGRRRSKGGD